MTHNVAFIYVRTQKKAMIPFGQRDDRESGKYELQMLKFFAGQDRGGQSWLNFHRFHLLNNLTR